MVPSPPAAAPRGHDPHVATDPRVATASLRDRLREVHVYAVTPFAPGDLGRVDLAGFRDNLDRIVARGVRVVAVGGGTGEFEALSNDEFEALADAALRAVGDRALVIATLPANLRNALDLIPRYEALGVEVVLAMPPTVRGRVPSDLRGTFDYYRRLADALGIPLMPYNTQVWPAAFYAELAAIDAIVAIKDPMLQPHTLFQAIQALGDRFVWIGNKLHDPGVVHLRYQMGMEAFTSGQGNFWPEPELEIHEAARAGDWARVVTLQQRCAPLERLRAESDDAAMVKAAMDLLGLRGGAVRPPRLDLIPAARAALRDTLTELGLAPVAEAPTPPHPTRRTAGRSQEDR
jgi:dihydrodipicolinate synthase/N-acetylneuraminate lyase